VAHPHLAKIILIALRFNIKCGYHTMWLTNINNKTSLKRILKILLKLDWKPKPFLFVKLIFMCISKKTG